MGPKSRDVEKVNFFKIQFQFENVMSTFEQLLLDLVEIDNV